MRQPYPPLPVWNPSPIELIGQDCSGLHFSLSEAPKDDRNNTFAESHRSSSIASSAIVHRPVFQGCVDKSVFGV